MIYMASMAVQLCNSKVRPGAIRALARAAKRGH